MNEIPQTAPAKATDTETVEQDLYQKRKKIYPREVHGIFAAMRVAGVAGLLGFYYLMPWILWDGRQAILFDLPERKFYILGMVFWPQDFIYLTLLLVVAALSLFFFTALAGRLWCGYACPQTVWTEAFLWIERKVEGSRQKQMKRDQRSMDLEKFSKKFLKHFLWLAFALFTGFTFVGYFTPIRELAAAIPTLDFGGWEAFWILFYGFATYGNAGWLREQVCIYMCPYARFQSAMFDKNTLIISYDEKRGEPRGARKKSADPQALGLGSCVDCSICVQVCPTGIDIRDGLQYQCIGCAACIDACDEVMDKMGYAKGLIKYTTQNRLDGDHTSIFRPRIILYASILLAIVVGTIIGIINRSPIDLDIIRDRNSLFRETGIGTIENVYTLKVINKDVVDHAYNLSVDGIEGMKLHIQKDRIFAESGAVIELPVSIEMDPDKLTQRTTEIFFKLETIDADMSITEEARFLGPLPMN
ncbi:MAG: cytochrome c oxidase accessory protein CcoG [Gammaproteobacteria bacterium]|nr:cytochrome c oxidase accessory protein CcoG [Gammaproteobacteria bacterium]